MLRSVLNWLTGRSRRPEPVRVDALALQITRRQRRLARRLAPYTDRTPEQLLDYKRADGIVGKRH